MARLFGRKPRPPDTPAAAEVVVPEKTPGQARAEQITTYRPGRPVAGADKRMRRVNLSLSMEEHMRWSAYAHVKGIPLSRWVREQVNGLLNRGVEEESDQGELAAELAGVRTELRRIGSNLNQVARGFNAEAKDGPEVDRDQALEELRAIRVAHEEIRTHLRGLQGQP